MSSKVQGFIYLAEDSSMFAVASVGTCVRLPERKPPWLVVHHTSLRMPVTRWPGRLLRVDVVDPVSEADGVAELVSSAGYTRAVEVCIVEELSPSTLFGTNGSSVAEVVDAALALSLDAATLLAANVHERAGITYSTAWDEWLRREGRDKSPHFGNHHSMVVAIPERGKADSPINQGLSLVAAVLRRRAIQVSGADATYVDDEEQCLAPPWGDAAEALLGAAMALGAPALLNDAELEILLQPWRHLRPAK